MRWTYEIETGAFYFYIADGGQPDRQREFNDGLVVDLDEAGNVIGVEYRLGAPGLRDEAFRGLVGVDDASAILFAVSNPPAPLRLPATTVPVRTQATVFVVRVKGPAGPRVGEAVTPDEVELQLQNA